MPLDAARRGTRALAALVRRNAWRIGLLFVGMLLPLWIFAELADEVHEMERLVFDEPILLHANGLAGPGLDGFFAVVSKLGYEGVIAMDVGLVAALLALKHWRAATFAATAFLGSSLLNMGAKQFFQRDRPTLWESISPEDSFAFPSGHAMGSMTLVVTSILLAWPSRWRWPVLVPACVFAVLVGYSRIYLGVHFPSDILAGWMVGTAWVVGVYLVLLHTPGRPWNCASLRNPT